jgi:hypothetical protein
MKRFTDYFTFKRRHQLFEFHDLNWVPQAIRDDLVFVDMQLHELFNTKQCFVDLVTVLVKRFNVTQIVDLCSGAGGIVPLIQKELKKSQNINVSVTLTDLFPPSNVEKINQPENNLYYEPQPINAADLPEHLIGMRTLFGGFHHLPPNLAKAVLQDAYKKRQPIIVGELQENNFLQCLGAFATFFIAWWALSFRRPITIGRFMRATLIPIVPLMHCWDAFASVLRTHTRREIVEMTRSLNHNYEWQIGEIQVPGFLTPAPYLMGLPK